MKLPAPVARILQNQYVMLLRETFSEWSADHASQLAAGLAYYALFSLAPLLVIAIFIVGLVFGEAAASGQLMQQIEGVVGTGTAQMIQTMIANAGRDRSGGIFSTIVGIVVLLLGASGVFGALKASLNQVWDVKPKKRKLLETIRDQLVPYTLVLGIGFLLLVTLVISAVLAAVTAILADVLPGVVFMSFIANYVLSFFVATILFAAIYKVLPDKEIAWRDVWIGAAVTALMFVIGKELIGFYLGRAAVGSAYGAAASLVVLLVWIYYSAQILLFGAEFTKVWARKYGTEKARAETLTKSSGATLAENKGQSAETIKVRPEPQAAAGRAVPKGMHLGPYVGYVGIIFGIVLGWMLAKLK